MLKKLIINLYNFDLAQRPFHNFQVRYNFGFLGFGEANENNKFIGEHVWII